MGAGNRVIRQISGHERASARDRPGQMSPEIVLVDVSERVFAEIGGVRVGSQVGQGTKILDGVEIEARGLHAGSQPQLGGACKGAGVLAGWSTVRLNSQR